MEDYFEFRRYFIDMATYQIVNNLNFNTKIIPKNFYEDRDKILYYIGKNKFYEARMELNKPFYYQCPAKGALEMLIALEEYLKRFKFEKPS